MLARTLYIDETQSTEIYWDPAVRRWEGGDIAYICSWSGMGSGTLMENSHDVVESVEKWM